MTDNGDIIIRSILSDISNENEKNIIANLKRLPLSEIPSDKCDLLLKIFVTATYNNNNRILARTIIDIFNLERCRIDSLPINTKIFHKELFNDDMIKFIIECYPQKILVDYFCDLVNLNDDKLAVEIAKKMVNFFKINTVDEWHNILRCISADTDEDENNELKLFLTETINNCESSPVWVVNCPLTNPKPLTFTLPSVPEAIDFIINDLKFRNIKITKTEKEQQLKKSDIMKFRENIGCQYAISTITEKITMLSPFTELEMFDDCDIFREFGPVNNMYTVSKNCHNDNDECQKYGGCRMLLCKDFVRNYNNVDNFDLMTIDDHFYISDWFTQNCDVCKITIKYKHYALRKPLIFGGWSGCYCSFHCLNSDVDLTDTNTSLMIGRMQEQLTVIGIRQR